MSFRVEITEPAEQDAREAVRWIAQHSPEKASLWYFDFLEAADSLREFPTRCPIAPESNETKEFRHLLFEKYRLIFLIEDEVVYILHIRHQRQGPIPPGEL